MMIRMFGWDQWQLVHFRIMYGHALFYDVMFGWVLFWCARVVLNHA